MRGPEFGISTILLAMWRPVRSSSSDGHGDSSGCASGSLCEFNTAVPASAGYGGFWIRFVAAILDGILVQVVVVPVSIMVGAVIGAAGFAVSMPSMGVRLVSMIVGGTLGL